MRHEGWNCQKICGKGSLSVLLMLDPRCSGQRGSPGNSLLNLYMLVSILNHSFLLPL